MKRIPMILAILAAAALAVLNLAWDFGPEPDVVYPICNQRITWLGK